MEIKRRDSGGKKFWIPFAVVLMIVVGLIVVIFVNFSRERQILRLDGHVFEQKNGYWVTEVNNIPVKILSREPYEIAKIPVEDSIGEKLRASRMLYIAFPMKVPNPEFVSAAVYELAEFLNNRRVYTTNGIADNNTGLEFLPILGCRDASPEVPVILFASTNETSSRIVMEGDCIRLEAARPVDFIALKDRLILKIAGIV